MNVFFWYLHCMKFWAECVIGPNLATVMKIFLAKHIHSSHHRHRLLKYLYDVGGTCPMMGRRLWEVVCGGLDELFEESMQIRFQRLGV